MNERIVGVTVGTSTSPDAIKEKMDLSDYADKKWVQEGYQPKGDYLTEHQDISGKLDANKLPEAINSALAQAKASGEFDGEDGYTPQKGVDYFDGKDGVDGKNGKDGYSPIKGVDYFDGADGPAGKDGKTPVKGTDYFTDADKNEIVSAVIASLPVYNGEVIEL